MKSDARPATRPADVAFVALLAATALALAALIVAVFLVVPTAQREAGGVAQRIFYFHVPTAYAMYVSGAACFVGSAWFLASPGERANAWARAGAETAVAFGLLVLVSGPLWAKKAWGVYWTWEPRLTTSLLTVLIYLAIAVLRRFGGDGDAERKFAAALGVLGTALLPIVHYATTLWGGNHPRVVGGGGLREPRMLATFLLGLFAMTLLAAVLLWVRARGNLAEARLNALEEDDALEYG